MRAEHAMTMWRAKRGGVCRSWSPGLARVDRCGLGRLVALTDVILGSLTDMLNLHRRAFQTCPLRTRSASETLFPSDTLYPSAGLYPQDTAIAIASVLKGLLQLARWGACSMG